MTIVGTRPEVIKMAPVVRALEADRAFDVCLCVVPQQGEVLDSALREWQLKVDVRLELGRSEPSIAGTLAGVVAAVGTYLAAAKPDYVLVQGDTTTALGAAMAAFYARIPIGHVEAGLRSGQMHDPFPEEMHRKLIDTLATVHYVPTERARDALVAEGFPSANVVLVGNTVVDALRQMRSRIHATRTVGPSSCRMILVTAHRRESFSHGIRSISLALRTLVRMRPDVEVVYVLHPNPLAHGPVTSVLQGEPRVHLVSPQNYQEFVDLLDRCYLVVTDSGGVQEEAPYLGKPVLVTRDVTERPEAVELGLARIVGTDHDTIVSNVLELLDDPAIYTAMTAPSSPFGDGNAAERIGRDLRVRVAVSAAL